MKPLPPSQPRKPAPPRSRAHKARATTAPSPPPLPRRLAAIFYDTLLLIAVLAAATALYIGIQAGLSGAELPTVDTDQTITELSTPASGPLYQSYLATIVAIFFIYFWRHGGQTLGMQTWRLRLENDRPGPPGLGQCLLRLAGAALSALAFGAGYWWMIFDRENLTWHDRLSRTHLVTVPKK